MEMVWFWKQAGGPRLKADMVRSWRVGCNVNPGARPSGDGGSRWEEAGLPVLALTLASAWAPEEKTK